MSDKLRSRSWCMVINNYSEEEENSLKEFFNNVEYGIYGREIAPTTGTPHLQIYFRKANAITQSSLKKKFPRAKLIVAKGSDKQNNKYCGKEDTNYYEVGKMSEQGKRTDLDEIKNEIMNGKKVDDIVLESPMVYHQYGRTLHKIEDLRMRKVYRTEMTEGIWYYGETGCGKSTKAFEGFNPDTHYVWKYENWQDGYTQQDVVIIDEFRGQIKYSQLLTLIDIQPNCYVYRRNREPLPFTSKKVIITSVLRPEEVYNNLSVNDSLDQLFRRIKIIKLEKNKILDNNIGCQNMDSASEQDELSVE